MHEPINIATGSKAPRRLRRPCWRRSQWDGAFFVFCNRRRQMLRVLFYDGSGFWLCTTRLSKGCFFRMARWRRTGPCSALLARELQVLIWGRDSASCAFPELWRKVA
jgi:hypothetical protein